MKVVSRNKKAGYDNEIIEKYIAGVVLTGAEVKSVKAGQCKIDGAYVFVNRNGAVLRNAIIPMYEHANLSSKAGYVPEADRVLLLTRKQLAEIVSKRLQMRAHVVPVSVGIDHNLVKVEIAIARPLKKYDKKNRKKEREEKLKIQRINRTGSIERD